MNKYFLLTLLCFLISITFCSAQCADVYFLRSKKGLEPSNTVYVLQDGVQITSMKKGTRLHAKICTEGKYKFSTSISADNFALFSSKTLNIESGNTYYIKVGVILGIDEPYLKVLSESKGEKLFKSNVYKEPLQEIVIKEQEQEQEQAISTDDRISDIVVKQENTSGSVSTDRSIDPEPEKANIISDIVSDKIIQPSGAITSATAFWKPISKLKFKERSAVHYTPLKLSPEVAVNCKGTILAVPGNRFLVQTNDEGLLLKSTDNGETWIDLTASIPYLSDIFKNNLALANARSVGIQSIAAAANDFYLTFRFGDKVALLRSTDEGKSWTLLPVEFSANFSNLEILPSGDIIQDNEVKNSTYIDTGLKEHVYTVWDDASKSWITVRDCKLLNSTRFSSLEYIYRLGTKGSALKEYKRVRNYPNPTVYDFDSQQEYFYELSVDQGQSWQKVLLPKDLEFWVKPWMVDKRARTIKDNTVWIQQTGSNKWTALFKTSKKEYIFSGFTTGVNGFGYVIDGSKLYKSKSLIYGPGADCSCQATTFPYYLYPESACDPNAVFDSGSPQYSKKVDKIEIRGSTKFIEMVSKALTVLKKDAPDYYNYYISNNTPNQKNVLRGIGLDCHHGSHTIDAFNYVRLVVENEWRYNRFNDNPEIAAGLIIHEAVHVHQAEAYMNTVGNGSFESFLNHYGQNRKSFEEAASEKQIDYLKFALSKFEKDTPKFKLIEQEIKRIQEYKNSY